ncbi:MAG TPA: PilZ domain-containing protein [Clostridia bacterium]|nr:PilZ domain-containing protein [Clostridia bacterium]
MQGAFSIRPNQRNGERRLSPRGRLHSHATVSVGGLNEQVALIDLSQAGAAITTEAGLEQGAIVEVTFVLPHIDNAIRCEGRVIWSDGAGHAGVQFTNISDEIKFQIGFWLAHEDMMV